MQPPRRTQTSPRQRRDRSEPVRSYLLVGPFNAAPAGVSVVLPSELPVGGFNPTTDFLDRLVVRDSHTLVLPLHRSARQSLHFDDIFTHGPLLTPEHLYAQIMPPLVQGVVDGVSGTVLTFGHSGPQFKERTLHSLVELSLQGIFDEIAERTRAEGSFCSFLVRCSMFEIYNEEIRDLLFDTRDVVDDEKTPPTFRIREARSSSSSRSRVFIRPPLQSFCVRSVRAALKVFETGCGSRMVAATMMSMLTMRSFVFYQIEVQSRDAVSGDVCCGTLRFVLTPEAERIHRTGAMGALVKEAISINRSLGVLRTVVASLAETAGKKNQPDQRFLCRASMITRYMQNSFCGTSRLVVLGSIPLVPDSLRVTLDTVRFVSQARRIRNVPTILRLRLRTSLMEAIQEDPPRLVQRLANVHPLLVATGIRKTQRNARPEEALLRRRLVLKRCIFRGGDCESEFVDERLVFSQQFCGAHVVTLPTQEVFKIPLFAACLVVVQREGF